MLTFPSCSLPTHPPTRYAAAHGSLGEEDGGSTAVTFGEEGAAIVDARPLTEELKGTELGGNVADGVGGKEMRYTAFDNIEREKIKAGVYVVDDGRVSKTGAAFIAQVRGMATEAIGHSDTHLREVVYLVYKYKKINEPQQQES